LAVDGWAVTFGTARRGLDRLRRIVTVCLSASKKYFYLLT